MVLGSRIVDADSCMYISSSCLYSVQCTQHLIGFHNYIDAAFDADGDKVVMLGEREWAGF